MAIKHVVLRGFGNFGDGVKYLPTRGYLSAFRAPWCHPIALNSHNSIRIAAGSGRILANASMPRIELDGDTDIDTPTDNERVEVDT